VIDLTCQRLWYDRVRLKHIPLGSLNLRGSLAICTESINNLVWQPCRRGTFSGR